MLTNFSFYPSFNISQLSRKIRNNFNLLHLVCRKFFFRLIFIFNRMVNIHCFGKIVLTRETFAFPNQIKHFLINRPQKYLINNLLVNLLFPIWDVSLMSALIERLFHFYQDSGFLTLFSLCFLLYSDFFDFLSFLFWLL